MPSHMSTRFCRTRDARKHERSSGFRLSLSLSLSLSLLSLSSALLPLSQISLHCFIAVMVDTSVDILARIPSEAAAAIQCHWGRVRSRPWAPFPHQRPRVLPMNSMNDSLPSYVVNPPVVTSLPVRGTKARFPIRRVYCVGRNYAAHA